MRDFDIRQRMRDGWTLERGENGSTYLRSPSGETESPRTLAAAVARMCKGPYPLLREVDVPMSRLTRWELC